MTGETETLTFGSPAPPRIPRFVVVAGLLAALVTGYLVGVRGDEGTPAVADREDAGPSLVAGSVREGPDAWERLSFELVLHNSGTTSVVVYLERIGPIDVRRDATRGPVRVAAGSTALIDVVAPMAVFWGDSLLFEPGTDYSYSTYGWTVEVIASPRTTAMPRPRRVGRVAVLNPPWVWLCLN